MKIFVIDLGTLRFVVFLKFIIRSFLFLDKFYKVALFSEIIPIH